MARAAGVVEEIRRGADHQAVNLPSQGPVKIGPVEGQHDGGLGRQGSDDHGTILCFGKNQGPYAHSGSIRDQLQQGLDQGFPNRSGIRADFGEIA